MVRGLTPATLSKANRFSVAVNVADGTAGVLRGRADDDQASPVSR